MIRQGANLLPYHDERSVLLSASPDAVFAHLDDFGKVRMHGRIMGIDLAVTEAVTERDPPLRKVWQTARSPRFIIGQYRLGFELIPEGDATRTRIFIDYALPVRLRWLGAFFGPWYARWRAERMAAEAARHCNGQAAGQISAEEYYAEFGRVPPFL